jgi:RimJ/RimL family protein N-acetyltransferase
MNHYVAGADYGEVYRLFTNPSVNPLIINKPDHNSMGAFSKWLDRHLETDFNDFMVFRTEEEAFVGFAYSYDFHALDGHCLFTVAVKPEYQMTGGGGMIALQFLEYLFKNYNLRKAYIHVYGNNAHSRRCAEAFGFQLEGTLQEYRFFDGKFEDLLIYAVTRQGFHDITQRIGFRA